MLFRIKVYKNNEITQDFTTAVVSIDCDFKNLRIYLYDLKSKNPIGLNCNNLTEMENLYKMLLFADVETKQTVELSDVSYLEIFKLS